MPSATHAGMIVPPANIAPARAPEGRAESLRSRMFVNANATPPVKPSQSARDSGNGIPAPGRHSTMTAPLTASRTRPIERGRIGSSSSTRAKSTDQIGIR